MAAWNKDMLVSFIKMYRSEESLWKIKSKVYSNKFIREQAYTKLVEFCQQFDNTVNKDVVLRKINNIRTTFRRELKKMESSKLSGAGSDEFYEPKLWYFNDLLFLRDQETTRSGVSNLQETQSEDGMDTQGVTPSEITETPKEEDLSMEQSDEEEHQVTPSPQTSTLTPQTSTATLQTSAPRTPVTGRRGTKRKTGDDDVLINAARQRLPNPPTQAKPDDEHDIFGKIVAIQMRGLDCEQKAHAQKIITEVLYEAGFKQLSRQSKLLTS